MVSESKIQKNNSDFEEKTKINPVELRYRSIFPQIKFKLRDLRYPTEIDSSKNQLMKNLMQFCYEIDIYRKGKRWFGVNDDGNYLTSFRELFYFTESEKVKTLAFERLHANQKWLKRRLKKASYKNSDMYRSVNYFNIFLNWIYELDPGNSIVKKQLAEVASYILVPPKKARNIPWYDFEFNRFKKINLNTKKIEHDYLNVIDHLRLLTLGWLAYASSGIQKLKQFIISFSDEWVEEICNTVELPIFLNPNKRTDPENGKIANSNHFKINDTTTYEVRNKCLSEMHIVNGTHDFLFKLYDLTHDEKYLFALEKVLRPLLDQISNPYAHPVGPILWKAFSIGLFEDKKSELIRKTIDSLSHIVCVNTEKIDIKINPNVAWEEPKFDWLRNGVGMKSDMPAVLYRIDKDEKWNHLPSMGAFYFAYRATKNQKYAVFALKLANKILNIARRLFVDGKSHGCCSKLISAFCIGHERDSGWGYASTTLRMLMPDVYPALSLPDIKL